MVSFHADFDEGETRSISCSPTLLIPTPTVLRFNGLVFLRRVPTPNTTSSAAGGGCSGVATAVLHCYCDLLRLPQTSNGDRVTRISLPTEWSHNGRRAPHPTSYFDIPSSSAPILANHHTSRRTAGDKHAPSTAPPYCWRGTFLGRGRSSSASWYATENLKFLPVVPHDGP